jgi:hypothetical protein
VRQVRIEPQRYLDPNQHCYGKFSWATALTIGHILSLGDTPAERMSSCGSFPLSQNLRKFCWVKRIQSGRLFRASCRAGLGVVMWSYLRSRVPASCPLRLHQRTHEAQPKRQHSPRGSIHSTLRCDAHPYMGCPRPRGPANQHCGYVHCTRRDLNGFHTADFRGLGDRTDSIAGCCAPCCNGCLRTTVMHPGMPHLFFGCLSRSTAAIHAI